MIDLSMNTDVVFPKKRITLIERQGMSLSPYQKDCIVGHLLGDGYLTKTPGKNTNTRFGFTQSSKKKDYFQNVFSNFSSLCYPGVEKSNFLLQKVLSYLALVLLLCVFLV